MHSRNRDHVCKGFVREFDRTDKIAATVSIPQMKETEMVSKDDLVINDKPIVARFRDNKLSHEFGVKVSVGCAIEIGNQLARTIYEREL